MNNQPKTSPNYEEELAKMDLPKGIKIRCRKGIIEITTEQLEPIFNNCSKNNSSHTNHLSSAASSSDPSSEKKIRDIKNLFERAIDELERDYQ